MPKSAKPAPLSGFCPEFQAAVELIGRRWTGAVVRMLVTGPRRYAELAAGIPDISDRMLSERLRELEAEGILTRTVVPDTPVRVEYGLTPKGHALETAIRAIGEWAGKWTEAEPRKKRA
jgi:DNA-binding HxlR family transcriptional regulator